jgi:hypothetical protein
LHDAAILQNVEYSITRKDPSRSEVNYSKIYERSCHPYIILVLHLLLVAGYSDILSKTNQFFPLLNNKISLPTYKTALSLSKGLLAG